MQPTPVISSNNTHQQTSFTPAEEQSHPLKEKMAAAANAALRGLIASTLIIFSACSLPVAATVMAVASIALAIFALYSYGSKTKEDNQANGKENVSKALPLGDRLQMGSPDKIRMGLKNGQKICWLNSAIKYLATTHAFDGIFTADISQCDYSAERIKQLKEVQQSLGEIVALLREGKKGICPETMQMRLIDALRPFYPFKVLGQDTFDSSEFMAELFEKFEGCLPNAESTAITHEKVEAPSFAQNLSLTSEHYETKMPIPFEDLWNGGPHKLISAPETLSINLQRKSPSYADNEILFNSNGPGTAQTITLTVYHEPNCKGEPLKEKERCTYQLEASLYNTHYHWVFYEAKPDGTAVLHDDNYLARKNNQTDISQGVMFRFRRIQRENLN